MGPCLGNERAVLPLPKVESRHHDEMVLDCKCIKMGISHVGTLFLSTYIEAESGYRRGMDIPGLLFGRMGLKLLLLVFLSLFRTCFHPVAFILRGGSASKIPTSQHFVVLFLPLSRDEGIVQYVLIDCSMWTCSSISFCITLLRRNEYQFSAHADHLHVISLRFVHHSAVGRHGM